MAHDHLNTTGRGPAKAGKRDVLPLPRGRFPAVTHDHGRPPAGRHRYGHEIWTRAGFQGKAGGARPAFLAKGPYGSVANWAASPRLVIVDRCAPCSARTDPLSSKTGRSVPTRSPSGPIQCQLAGRAKANRLVTKPRLNVPQSRRWTKSAGGTIPAKARMRTREASRSGAVPLEVRMQVGVCRTRTIDALLCATGTERRGPCVPQGQNGAGLVCHKSGMVRAWVGQGRNDAGLVPRVCVNVSGLVCHKSGTRRAFGRADQNG